MAVYPFYANVNSSTRKSSVGVGARSKSGNLTTTIYQREKGEITCPFLIHQYTEEREDGLVCITKVYYLGEVIQIHESYY